MIEIPESTTLSAQANDTLMGNIIVEVINASSPHKFAFYCGNPADYSPLLVGRKIESIKGHGMFVDLHCDSNVCITIGDGCNLRHFAKGEKYPEKHQLMIVFDKGNRIVFTVAMYGCIFAYKGDFDNKYHQGSLNSISPLNTAFNESYFDSILKGVTKDLSAKAMLATEQRIPGLGNGVLQDILFNAGIHPKRKISKLSDVEKGDLYYSLKTTLQKMTDNGGRDTEKDFFGNNGGYKTILSKNTIKQPCPNCGDTIVKEAYLGGAVYYCPTCQRL